MYIGIKDGKIFDIVSDLRHKRDINDKTVKYIEMEMGDIFIGDSWENNTNLKDSPQRLISIPEPKDNLELEEIIKDLEARIKKLEGK